MALHPDRGRLTRPSRRALLGGGGVVVGSLLLQPRFAQASEPGAAPAIAALTGGAPIETGRVWLDISPLVDNGNTVPVTLGLDAPMTETDHVRRLALFTERNPQPEVAVFTLGPLCGRARVATRMRLATSQTVWALAQTGDGRWWRHGVDVVVTLAACVEG